MNEQSIIKFQLKELAKLLKQPTNCEVIALRTYTLEILQNLGLTAREAFDKANKLSI